MKTDESYRIEWKGKERVLIKNGTEVFTGTFKGVLEPDGNADVLQGNWK